MTNKKKIIISSYDDITNPYYHGGGAICIHEVAKGLRPLYNITVLTSKHVGSHRDEEKDGVFYKRIGHTPAFFPPIGQMIFTLLLPVYVRLLSFDIWIESFTPPFSTAFLPVFTKKPVMGLAHFLSGEEMRKRYKLPFDLIEKIGLRRYSRFIVPHMVTGKKILETVPDAQVRCIPNGVHLPKRRNTKTQKIVSLLGRI
jgi:hypothetical protein